MDILTRMNRALDYIEANLLEEIDLAAVARLACTSSFNFQRMFAFMTDVTLAEYIRRRRLTLAALALRQGGERVVDIALRHGYDSPVSFARAFTALHGMTPSAARAAGATLKAYPRLSFQITIKGEKGMDYRIETLEAFDIFGFEGVFESDEARQGEDTPKALWRRNQRSGAFEKLGEDAGTPPAFVPEGMDRVHGFCSYRDTGEDTFSYMLGAFRGPQSRVEGYTLATIPAHTWAVFPSEPYDWADFDDVIDGLYRRFFTEWLPTSRYEQVGGLDFELYAGDEKGGRIELWFAVRK